MPDSDPSSEATEKASSASVAAAVLAALALAGVVLRILTWWRAGELWHDEAALAVNVVERGAVGLLGPLDHGQVAPPGFLLLVKWCSLAFGDSERALRIIPLASSVAALLVFALLTRRVLRPWPAALAVAVFAFSHRLVHYAGEFKQYGTDLLLGAALLLLMELSRESARWRTCLIAIGVVSPWVSFPMAFLLPAIAGSLLLNARRAGDRTGARRWLAAGVAWVVSAGTALAVSWFTSGSGDFMERFWTEAGGFAPMPPRSVADLVWYRDAAIGLFEFPVGLGFPVLGVLMAAAGLGTVMASQRVCWGIVGILPLALALAASAVHAYPFAGRLLLFAAPGLIVLIGFGVQGLWRSGSIPARWAAVAAAAIIVQPLLTTGMSRFMRTPPKQETVALLRHIAAERAVGDVMVCAERTWPVFMLYQNRLGLQDMPALGAGYWPDESSVQKLLAGVPDDARVWLVLSGLGDADLLQAQTARQRAGREILRTGDSQLWLFEPAGP